MSWRKCWNPRSLSVTASDDMAKTTAPPFPLLDLNDGHKIPVLGLGCMEFVNEQSLVKDTVYEAIKAGYRHFDSAWIYRTESLVGQGIRKAIDEQLVTRDDIFVTTKIWMYNLRREDLISQAKESNAALALGHIDLLLIHGPLPCKRPSDATAFMALKADGTPDLQEDVDIHTESWHAMEEVVKMGIAKSIGVSNYDVPLLMATIANATIKPAVNQIESNVFLQQKKVISFCREQGIIVTAYAPFGGPVHKSPPGSPEDWNKNQETTKPLLWNHPLILRIAEKHKKTVSQILIKFHVSRAVTVIPKTIRTERLAENADVFDFEFDDQDIRDLEGLDAGLSSTPEVYRKMMRRS